MVERDSFCCQCGPVINRNCKRGLPWTFLDKHMFISLLGIYLRVAFLHHRVYIYSAWINIVKQFSKVNEPLYSLQQQYMRVSVIPHPLQNLICSILFLVVVVILVHVYRYLIVAQNIFIVKKSFNPTMYFTIPLRYATDLV